MSERWLVIGGGFRGIIAAYLLASKGKNVVLIERSPHLGGVLYSSEWKGFYLDKGCHLFDNTSDMTTSIIMEILQGDYAPVSVSYASVINAVKTDEIAIPNLASFGKNSARDILMELLIASTKPELNYQNLQENLDARFGAIAGSYLAIATEKMYRTKAIDLASEAFALTPFNRINFLDDAIANVLKESPTLDNLVAASSQSDPMKFYRDQAQAYDFRNFYPKHYGMRGFCEKAKQHLVDLGVSMVMGSGIERLDTNNTKVKVMLSNGEEIAGDRIVWTAGIESFAKLQGYGEIISQQIHHVPMLLYYFAIEKEMEGKYTYLHNFDTQDLFFRASIPSSYGVNNCPEGLSYVCCEVPTNLDSPEWDRPEIFLEQVWFEMKQYEVIKQGNPMDSIITKTPTSYKMPKIGYPKAAEEITSFWKDNDLIIGLEQWDFSKNDIIQSLNKALK
jgi:protoporphyrinogen oxidase